MKNINSGVNYYFKNFFVISLFSLPVAIVFALKYNSSYFFDYILNLNSIGNSTLINIYSHFSLLPSLDILTVFLWSIMVICCFCLLFSYSERHMKFGIKSFVKSFKSINFSILAVLPAFITVVGLEELFSFMVALFVNLFSLSQSEIINFIFPLIFLFLIIILFLIYSVIALWIPIKMVTGYSNRDSIRYSIRLTQGRQISIMLGIAFPLIITCPIMIFLKQFSQAYVLNITVYVLCYLFIVGYLVSYLMVTYFYLSGTERKDIKKKFI